MSKDYIIIKESDAEKYLTKRERQSLIRMLNKITEKKSKKHIKTIKQTCIDCLCSVCNKNECITANGSCKGCNNCSGIIETEEDCVQEYEYIGD